MCVLCVSTNLFLSLSLYTYISIEKMRGSIRGLRSVRVSRPLARSLSRSGLAHFSAQDHLGPPTVAPRATQDRPQRPKTAHIGPQSGPRPPT